MELSKSELFHAWICPKGQLISNRVGRHLCEQFKDWKLPVVSSTSQTNVTSYLDTKDSGPSEETDDAVGVLMWFGALMLRAGNTATRTREWIDVIARQMGFAAVAVSLSLDSITVSVRRSGEWVTTMREIGPPGINAWRIAELEQLARTVGPGDMPRDIAARLAKIEVHGAAIFHRDDCDSGRCG